MSGFVQDYIDAGWEAPFPMRPGQKFPPPTGVTGNIPALAKRQVQNLWEGKGNHPAVALRLQASGTGVVALDIDDYNNKGGRANLEALEKELGSLNLDQVPRSNRRGPNDKGGHYFFRVPRNEKYAQSACQGVDVLQLTHRYSVVWPSVVDDLQYRWYLGNEEIRIPHVKDLPTLPQPWVEHLKRGVSNSRNVAPAKLGEYREAVNWMRDNFRGWDPQTEGDSASIMSAPMREACESEKFLEGLETNGHDTMLSAVHTCIRYGVEGHNGLKLALGKITNAFLKAVEDRRESEAAAKEEVRRAIIGEVEQVISEVEAGYIRLARDYKDLDLSSAIDKLVELGGNTRPKGVNYKEYSNTDQGNAKMFADYWGVDVLATSDTGSREFAVWNKNTGRYVYRGVDEMYGHVELAISSPLDYEADRLEEPLRKIIEKADEGQLSKEEDRILERDSGEIKALRHRANQMRFTTSSRQVLKQLHSIDGASIKTSEFDSKPGIIGTRNGEVLDLNALLDGDHPIRRSDQSDLLTMSTKVSVQPNAHHPAWEKFLKTFLPDEEVRKFAQRVFGYTLIDHNPSKLMMFLVGPSNTGKTTILEAIASALGDYAAPMSAHKLFGLQNSTTNPELVRAMKKRMVILSEIGSGYQLSANQIKQVTGNDLQQARNNFSNDIIEEVPQFTPYLSTNTPPEILHSDDATARRILALPFNSEQPPQRITFDNDLKNNPQIASAILWWLIEGATDYNRHGLLRETWPKAVRELSDAFSASTSEIRRFIEDCTEPADGKRVKLSAVYAAYQRWARAQGINQRDLMTRHSLGNALDSSGFQYVRNTSWKDGKNTDAIRGLALRGNE